jgi:hypothetical protein
MTRGNVNKARLEKQRKKRPVLGMVSFPSFLIIFSLSYQKVLHRLETQTMNQISKTFPV